MSDLREALESAVNEHTEEPTSTPEVAAVAPVETAPATVDAPSSSESETLGEASSAAPVPAKADAKPSIEDVVAEAEGQPTDKPETEAQKDARTRVDRAPQSWKGDAKKVWEQLPLNVRQEVARREREITTKLSEVAPVKQRMDSLMQVLTPHQERIQAVHGGNPLQAIERMMNVERIMFSGSAGDKAQLVANMIKEFKVDIASLDNLLSGEQLPAPVQQQTDIERLLEQKLAPVQQFIQAQQQSEQRRAQQVEQEAVHTVETMAVDPNFPYFDDVRDDMADLIEMAAKKGVALSLSDAYNKAIRMNDDTFQASSARSTTQAATQAALSAHQEAQKAKGAALSVSGAPSGVGTNFGNTNDLRGIIAAL